ncbi:unnamed protein product [Phytophthora fragariaefolia]|uniref:Unnamed protein product n=1 Tax=Phytophthora fragariaefolia TaxID=1490495 RepID=A0A9W7CMF1_9STRA|nr:unnamed protein product [Phytophthora fragariaefolia]
MVGFLVEESRLDGHGFQDTQEPSRGSYGTWRRSEHFGSPTRGTTCRTGRQVQPARPTETRRSVPSGLPKFKGKRGEVVRQWLFQMKTLCRIHGHDGGNDNTALPSITGTAMKDPASGWFPFWASRTPAEAQFTRDALAHFEASDYQAVLRQKLRQLRQVDDIEDYKVLCAMSEVDQVSYYCDGLILLWRRYSCSFGMSTPTTQAVGTPAASAAANTVVASSPTTGSSLASSSVVTSTVMTSSSPKRTMSLGEYKKARGNTVFARDELEALFDVGSDADMEDGEEDEETSSSRRDDPSLGSRRPREDDSDASSSRRSRSGNDRPLADAGPLSSLRSGGDSTPSGVETSRTGAVCDPWIPTPSEIQSRFGSTAPPSQYALYSCSSIIDDDVTKELDFDPATDPSRDYYIGLFHELRWYGNKKASWAVRVSERDINGYTGVRVFEELKTPRTNLIAQMSSSAAGGRSTLPRAVGDYSSRSSFTPFGGFGGDGLRTPSPFPERPASGRSAAPTYRGSEEIFSNEYENDQGLGSRSDDQQFAGRSSELPPVYVQVHTRKYRDWQLLAFAAATDGQLLDKERLLYEEWLAQQPPSVERRQYAAPGGVRSRPLDAPHGPTCEEQWKQLDELTGTDDGAENGVIDEVSSNQADSSISEEVNASSCPLDAGEHDDPSTISTDHGNQAKIGRRMKELARRTRVGPRHLPRWNGRRHGAGDVTVAGMQEMDDEFTDSTTDDPLADLHLRYAASADALMHGMDGENGGKFEYEGNEIHFEDYAHELAFLPDLTVLASTILDYDAPNCVISTCGHAPIKQRARRIPLNYLRKLYELLKGLLEAWLIAFSSSPWASPIVIVLKKNGQDIRLCIDYKMVNAITLIMEYAMPLIDDLLTEIESYLWFCSVPSCRKGGTSSSPSAQGVLHALGGKDSACLHTFLASRMGVPVQVVIRSLGAIRRVPVSMEPQDQARPRARH